MTAVSKNRQYSTDVPKVALVTGGAKRIGRAIAIALAQEGWDIVVHYQHSQDEAQATVGAIQAMGRRAVSVQADLAHEAQTEGIFKQATTLGRITCLVNNASCFVYDEIGTVNYANLQAHFLPNLAAPLVLARALHTQLPENQQGVVINLLDQKLHNLNPDFFSYTLSKAALETATLLLAQALAPRIRVVGVAPGITMPSLSQTEANFAQAHRHTPLGYSSRLEDIAQAVCYLVGATAVTGTTLLVDGGQHIQGSLRDVMFTFS